MQLDGTSPMQDPLLLLQGAMNGYAPGEPLLLPEFPQQQQQQVYNQPVQQQLAVCSSYPVGGCCSPDQQQYQHQQQPEAASGHLDAGCWAHDRHHHHQQQRQQYATQLQQQQQEVEVAGAGQGLMQQLVQLHDLHQVGQQQYLLQQQQQQGGSCCWGPQQQQQLEGSCCGVPYPNQQQQQQQHVTSGSVYSLPSLPNAPAVASGAAAVKVEAAADPCLLPSPLQQQQQEMTAVTAAPAPVIPSPSMASQGSSSSASILVPTSGQQFEAALSALELQPQQSSALLELLQQQRRAQRFQLQSLGYLGKAVANSSAEGLQELARAATRPCAAGLGSGAATLQLLDQLVEAFSAGHEAMKELMLAFWGSEVRAGWGGVEGVGVGGRGSRLTSGWGGGDGGL